MNDDDFRDAEMGIFLVGVFVAGCIAVACYATWELLSYAFAVVNILTRT